MNHLLAMLSLGSLPVASGLGLGMLLCACLTWLLACWARRGGLLDAPHGEQAARKLQRIAVPPVGGIALLSSLAILEWGCGWSVIWELRLPGQTIAVASPVVWLSLLSMLGVGLWDDLLPSGLGPWHKLLGQAFALLPLALGTTGILLEAAPADETGLWAVCTGLGVLAAGLWAVNVLNTFDNADGAAAGVSAAGFVCGALLLGLAWNSLGGAGVGGVILGFLLCNLNAPGKTAGQPGSATPSAYLGDSGAYVLGLLVLLQPFSWGVLWIPSLDLLRLSAVRLRSGSRPWIGDRLHLAHRLQRAGLDSRGVVLALVLLSLPGCLGIMLWPEKPTPVLLGLGTSALGFAGALWLTRATRDAPHPNQ